MENILISSQAQQAEEAVSSSDPNPDPSGYSVNAWVSGRHVQDSARREASWLAAPVGWVKNEAMMRLQEIFSYSSISFLTPEEAIKKVNSRCFLAVLLPVIQPHIGMSSLRARTERWRGRPTTVKWYKQAGTGRKALHYVVPLKIAQAILRGQEKLVRGLVEAAIKQGFEKGFFVFNEGTKEADVMLEAINCLIQDSKATRKLKEQTAAQLSEAVIRSFNTVLTERVLGR